MTESPRAPSHAEQARLARAVADTADHSAQVHDEMADTHERLDHPLLDPAELRRHAEQERQWAEQERATAEEVERADRDASP